MFKKNMGTVDRIVRIIIALCLFIGAYFISTVWVMVVCIALGLFVLYEALSGWCALYALLGRNTCPIE